ncbi:MAG TPA: phenylalanine 4-monooxygenase [Thermoanaerobaculia bacterium]|nr:phenylalanine 4-monooxygenase [Thermoanaerobaculia bacterium]
MAQTAPVSDLTTTRAPFIEDAKDQGQLFITQPYELYSEANQETWRRLYAALEPKWRRFAHPHFRRGLDRLALDPQRIPRLENVNEFLAPLSGFRSEAVSGYVPAYLFFDCLRRREFPTTITIRDGSRLDYLPEPDIFHDLAGHVPMHTDRRFSDVLVRFGEVAATAAKQVQRIDDEARQVRTVESIIKAMARFFWFTIEFGLMRRPVEAAANGDGELCVYGSGLLSSAEEIESSITSPDVQRYPFQLEWVVNQYFEIHHVQPLLFVVDDFDHLFEEVGRLEEWVLEGRLNNVAPGEPAVNEDDLRSFLHARH